MMLGTTHVYFVWYGNWAGNTGVQILTDLASNIGTVGAVGVGSTWHRLALGKTHGVQTVSCQLLAAMASN